MVKLVIKKKPTCIFKKTNVLILMTLVFYTKLLKILQYIQNCNKWNKKNYINAGRFPNVSCKQFLVPGALVWSLPYTNEIFQG
jgi:hypothetical protein